MFHFTVQQIQGDKRQFDDADRTFEVIPFSGHNLQAGMQGNTTGLVLNQIKPVKKTVLFTRQYYSDGAGNSAMCVVSKEFFDGIEDFLKRHEVECWGTPETMLERADGLYFVPAKESSEFVELHPDCNKA